MDTQSSQHLQKIMQNKYYKSVYDKINPILFDVSLRDGIQNAVIENFPTQRKIEIFQTLFTYYNPQNMEIGSLTNPKILPIMSDTCKLYDYVTTFIHRRELCDDYLRDVENLYPEIPRIFVLVPTLQKLELAIQQKMDHLSFITSVSEAFQMKNTRKTLQQTKEEFTKVFERLKREPDKKYTTKLYMSCINKCPVSGYIPNNFCIDEIIYYYNHYSFDELCLSDTCGELSFGGYQYIIDKCIERGIPKSLFSLHLHVSTEQYENLEQILFYSFSLGINKFDISLLETGGCSVTMKPKEIHSNLSYDLFYEILYKYITVHSGKNKNPFIMTSEKKIDYVNPVK